MCQLCNINEVFFTERSLTVIAGNLPVCIILFKSSKYLDEGGLNNNHSAHTQKSLIDTNSRTVMVLVNPLVTPRA